jgi:hypothetical protein
MVPKREDHTQREKAVAGSSGGKLVANQEVVNCDTSVSDHLKQQYF